MRRGTPDADTATAHTAPRPAARNAVRAGERLLARSAARRLHLGPARSRAPDGPAVAPHQMMPPATRNAPRAEEALLARRALRPCERRRRRRRPSAGFGADDGRITAANGLHAPAPRHGSLRGIARPALGAEGAVRSLRLPAATCDGLAILRDGLAFPSLRRLPALHLRAPARRAQVDIAHEGHNRPLHGRNHRRAVGVVAIDVRITGMLRLAQSGAVPQTGRRTFRNEDRDRHPFRGPRIKRGGPQIAIHGSAGPSAAPRGIAGCGNAQVGGTGGQRVGNMQPAVVGRRARVGDVQPVGADRTAVERRDA